MSESSALICRDSIYCDHDPVEEEEVIDRTIVPMLPEIIEETQEPAVEPENEPAPEPETEEEEVCVPADPVITYVLNINSMKFHYPDCSSVDDMKEKNKRYSYDDRDTVIAQGFVPCKRCNP